MSNIDEIKKFVDRRPKVKAAYGYGSGIFKQSGYTKKDKPQLDLILIVDDLKKWHLENMKLNPKDYSFIGKLFFRFASISKLKGTTGITYLSNIVENNLVFKYGTIEEKDLEKYLQTWESFYLPGRFQKTIYPIIENKNLKEKIEKNRKNALYTALLTIEDTKDGLRGVYTQLCGLSYLGDTRMKFAENPKKVSNIVEGSFYEFKKMYGVGNEYFHIEHNGKVITDYEKEVDHYIKTEINNDKLLEDINNLPDALLEYISLEIETGDINLIRQKILEYFTILNKNESTSQTIKGIYTNGVVRSVKYASQKVLKKIRH